MAKEFMSDRDKNPKYYERCACEDCDSEIDLVKHKFNDTVKCLSCLNDLITEIARLADIEEEKSYGHDESEALTLEERNS